MNSSWNCYFYNKKDIFNCYFTNKGDKKNLSRGLFYYTYLTLSEHTPRLGGYDYA